MRCTLCDTWCAMLYLCCESYSLHVYLLSKYGVDSWGGSLVFLEKKKNTLAYRKLNPGVQLKWKVSNFHVCEQQEWGKFLMILEPQFKIILTLHELTSHLPFPTGQHPFPAHAILLWTKLRIWSKLKLIQKKKKKRHFCLWLVPWSSSMSSSTNISASPREEAKWDENKLSGREGGQDCCLRQQWELKVYLKLQLEVFHICIFFIKTKSSCSALV